MSCHLCLHAEDHEIELGKLLFCLSNYVNIVINEKFIQQQQQLEKPWPTSSHCGKFVNLVEAFLFSIWLSRRWAAHMSFGLGLVFVFRIFFGGSVLFTFAANHANWQIALSEVCRMWSRRLRLSLQRLQARHINYSFRFFRCQTACCQKGIEEGVGGASRGCLPIRLVLEEESNPACSRPACDL